MDTVIHYQQDADQVVVLTLDMPGQKTNTMNADYREAMKKVVARLENERDNLSGIIITSAKTSFCAGGDLNELSEQADSHTLYQLVNDIKLPLRQLEMLGVPVVAAI